MASIALIDNLAIVQGKTYEKLDLLFVGDYSLWLPRAQIRNKLYYLENGADPLSEFSFLPMSYNSTTNRTLVSPRLSAINTASIAPTKYQGQSALTGCYVWDLELTDPDTGRVIGLDWDWVQVKPEATVHG